jgi:radical SAM superfamily enzyme YgiQ (UPF0313 family)
MIGTSNWDIQAIVDLTLAGKNIIDQKRGKTRLTVNLSPFVPKAGTPFQWLPMETIDNLQQRIKTLKNSLSHKGIQVNSESPPWSEVQAVLSRGDASLAKVLADIDRESLPAWRLAIEKHQVDIGLFAHQKWDFTRKLPWSFIDTGSKPQKLASELQKAVGGN